MDLTTKNNPLVSIIILNYNGKCYLNNCVKSVLATKYPKFELIVVDNASTDGSLERLLQEFGNDKRLKILRNSRNLGFGPANNVGYERAIGNYVVFLNNDTVVDPYWLVVLVEIMESDQSIGLAQSLLLNMSDHSVQNAGWLISDYFVCLHSIEFENNTCTNWCPDTFEISYGSGAAMITRRELIDEIGLFDPSYYWFYDDNFLSFKTWLVGKRVVTAAKSKVYHAGGGTAGFDSFFIRRHGTICLFTLIFDVYWKLPDLIRAIFVFNYYLGVMSLKEIFESHKTTRFSANISAIGWIFKNLKYIWKNRIRYQLIARVTQRTLLSNLMKIRVSASLCLVPSPSKLLYAHLNAGIRNYKNQVLLTSQQNYTRS